MQSTDSYMVWFRSEASKLPVEDRQAVLAALEDHSARAVFTALDALMRQGRLPQSWDEKLTDFFWTIW